MHLRYQVYTFYKYVQYFHYHRNNINKPPASALNAHAPLRTVRFDLTSSTSLHPFPPLEHQHPQHRSFFFLLPLWPYIDTKKPSQANRAHPQIQARVELNYITKELSYKSLSSDSDSTRKYTALR